MDLLLFTIGLPLAPIRGVMAIAEVLRREAEKELYDPANVRRQLEEIDRAVESGDMSSQAASRARSEYVARLVVPAGGAVAAAADTERAAGLDRHAIEGVIAVPPIRTSDETVTRHSGRNPRKRPRDGESYDGSGSAAEEVDRGEQRSYDRGDDNDAYDDGTGSEPPPKKRPRRPHRPDRMSASEASADGLDQIASLTGKDATGVTSIAPTDDGWLIEVEVVEDRRIPSTSDVLALYDVELGPDGSLLSYRRTRRYVRGHTDS